MKTWYLIELLQSSEVQSGAWCEMDSTLHLGSVSFLSPSLLPPVLFSPPCSPTPPLCILPILKLCALYLSCSW